ncbi:conserved hypothetical protein [Aspergillus terreus NIH2624]|uniref:Uncharacterized protein n=1 Tax=Aspergillus terreus (strain NIH 2624 / FGSC A1156) TaxID=341663 RepID=Q0CLU3_ASPTN|nr:uncharacterized protein ATEG_05341 [Aspergillus terreus NIH2624]EAU34410.1 conserved hypothetical protein [Aspergillus terreus NIH2624]
MARPTVISAFTQPTNRFGERWRNCASPPTIPFHHDFVSTFESLAYCNVVWHSQRSSGTAVLDVTILNRERTHHDAFVHVQKRFISRRTLRSSHTYYIVGEPIPSGRKRNYMSPRAIYFNVDSQAPSDWLESIPIQVPISHTLANLLRARI